MLILFNKPFNVITQFRSVEGRQTLADYIVVPDVHAAGRLDHDSEGLLLLTNDGQLQHRLTNPRFKLPKTYWAQIEGLPSIDALHRLATGVTLRDGRTRAAAVRQIPEPELWPRTPPIRFRQQIPTSWIEITITEGKNRQVRRMTASVGLPTLRLVRVAVGPYRVDGITPGSWREANPSLIEWPHDLETEHRGRGGHRTGRKISSGRGGSRRKARHQSTSRSPRSR